MKLYDGIKMAVAKGLLATTLATGGLVGIVNAQEPKFTPVKVNTLQKNIGDTLVYVSFYQMDKPNSSGIYPVQIKVYFGKRMDNMMISETKESETFNSTSDRCWELHSYNKTDKITTVMKLYDQACSDVNGEKTLRTTYERVGQGDFQKKK
jgi:hypothetical protein